MEIGPAFGIERTKDQVTVGFPQQRVQVTATVRDVDGVPQIVALEVQAHDPRSWHPAPHWTKGQQRQFRRMTQAMAANNPPTVISTDLLRAVPLRELLAAYLQMAPRPRLVDFDTELPPRTVGRERKTRQHYQEVAQVYRQALQQRRPPRVAIQQHFGVKRAAASLYIAKARDLGLLGDYPRPGIPGEVE